jgi:hypothetical protein
MALNGRMIVNDELRRMQKEVVVAYFKILSWNLPGRTDGRKAQKTFKPCYSVHNILQLCHVQTLC